MRGHSLNGDGITDGLGRWRDGDVDSDDLAEAVDQRAAAIAGVDCCVGLKEIVECLALRRENRTIEGTEHAHRDGGTAFQGQRVADGDDGFPDVEICPVAELRRDQIRGGDTHERKIQQKVAGDDPPGREPTCRQADDYAGHALHQVIVGEDVSVHVQNDAGTGSRWRAML